MRRPLKAKKRVCKKLGGGSGEDAKWLTHYCSDHEILLVGEGDFSFSLCLAKAFGSAANIVASSLDTYDDVIKKYKHAKSNLDELKKLGACLLHGVDATKMKHHSDLNRRRFDRVIYNFPHAGFRMNKKEDNLKMIKMHKGLVLGFLENASCMLRANGEIHVNHKTTPPFSNWNIEKLALQSSLILIECVVFNKVDYPGYNNKRGDGFRCDEPFPLGKCGTFKFIYNHHRVKKKKHFRRNHRQQTNLPFQGIQKLEQSPAPVDLNYYYYPQTSSLFPKMNEPVRPVFDLRNGYFNNHVTEIHGRVACSVTLDSRRLLHPMESLQSLQVRNTSTNCRNEGYHQYQVFGGSSRYLQEAVCRTAERYSSYCFDRARLDFKRCNADVHVPRRTLKSEIYVVQTLKSDIHVAREKDNPNA